MNKYKCDCNYFYNLFEIEETRLWGFKIGHKKAYGVIEEIAAKGAYESADEAEIAATAFIAGMMFITTSFN